jgi:hypothetical protein
MRLRNTPEITSPSTPHGPVSVPACNTVDEDAASWIMVGPGGCRTISFGLAVDDKRRGRRFEKDGDHVRVAFYYKRGASTS